MAEGFTNIYLDTDNADAREKLFDLLDGLGLNDIDSQLMNDEKNICLSFDHMGSYNEKKFTRIVKNLITEFPELFIRVRHYDDYGTEIFWLNDKGKLKKYLHEVDTESGNIVKAYNHWHSSLGSIWDGHFDREDIQRISERFGFYDEYGKAIKGEIENLAEIITSSESFFHKNLKASYASHKFDNDIAVLQSYAAIMVSKCEFVPTEKIIKFERTFVVKDAFNSTVMGFVWSWIYEGLETLLIISWHGELAVKAKIVVNHENLTTDEIIYVSVFDEFLKKEVVGDKQWVYSGIEQTVFPPSMEYIWDDSGQDREKYFAQNIVLQYMNIDILRGDNGNYRVESDGIELFEIDNPEFSEEMDSLVQEQFRDGKYTKASTSTNSETPRIWAQIQVQFKAPNTAARVLGIKVYGEENRKAIYKRYDQPSQTWPIPAAP